MICFLPLRVDSISDLPPPPPPPEMAPPPELAPPPQMAPVPESGENVAGDPGVASTAELAEQAYSFEGDAASLASVDR